MRNKIKVGLLDTSFSALPLLQTINQETVTVFVIGGKKDDFLCKFSDVQYIQADYSDIDVIKQIITSHKLDYVVPGCNDISYASYEIVSNASSKMGLAFDAINNKAKFRTLCVHKNVPAPIVLENQNGELDGPVIVKPQLSFSGRGITKLKAQFSTEALDTAISHAKKFSSNGKAVIEEFIEGRLFSVSLFIKNSNVSYKVFVNEFCIENEFAVNWSYVNTNFNEEFQSRFDDIPKALDIKNGLLHLQCITNDDLSFKVIEATRRCPGDLFPYLVEFQTGEHYSYRYLSEFLPEDLLMQKPLKKSDETIVRHTSSNYSEHTFLGFNHSSRKTILSVPTLATGQRNDNENKYRSGVHFYEMNGAPDENNLRAICNERTHQFF